jgi:hypothetical protein
LYLIKGARINSAERKNKCMFVPFTCDATKETVELDKLIGA